jgi:WhiB family transcriptional regulator, redox-sensing transcriptional regulator
VRTNQIPPEVDSERWVSYSIDDLYPDWQKRAHCRGVGVEYYFGDDAEQPTMSIKAVRRASKLCEVCPVYVECLTWALTTREEYGVWAGTSGRMRRRIFKLVDNGDTTVAEVVERFRNGQGDTYRLPAGVAQADSGAYVALRARAVGEGDPGLRAVDRREVAL